LGLLRLSAANARNVAARIAGAANAFVGTLDANNGLSELATPERREA